MMKKCLWLALMSVALMSCGKGSDGGAPSSSGDLKTLELVATQDGSPIKIDAAMFDTPAAKEFIATGKNPYVGKEDAIKEGRRKFNLFSCQACHGGSAEGAVGPSLQGPNFRYAKNASNKGMFETIWHGTNGGMGAKGFGLMAPNDGLKPDEVLKVIAFVRSNGKVTGNE